MYVNLILQITKYIFIIFIYQIIPIYKNLYQLKKYMHESKRKTLYIRQ